MSGRGKGKTLTIKQDQSFVVDSFEEQDAKGIANLFLAVYGREYPI